ncbi:TonB-linked outer membrane protein, SusC/RagA family [Pedobacter steynii]|uniref:TonB-linked outer membrane protein, SusC/RagA family n=1 Tax=Pedobacter steynii TaxID=430522 RepID=A0A1H0L5B8_9SPHI|nr:TonB-dependent receptor [Pedobacter steynii]NQX43418.1 TonB-dependent receptor [Pedobacter steynii]SDO63203.1 TonB-linked outer membrane protein, SusC/RagA family [Pedobacter steynii]
MQRFIYITLAMVFFVPGLLLAQTKVIKGLIRESGGPLPGATITEKGLPNNGAQTGVDGRFQLTLKGSSHTIVIRSIGFISQEINVANKSEVNVSLAVDAKGLEEVIVVGFGRQKKITNTGAVSSINASELRQNPTASVQNTLAGRLPGFFSQQRSGQPGKDGADFFIRGISSYTTGQRPLIIVDDIEYSYSDVSQLDPNEIESVTILKDASTTAIYGVKGANGVLVITTRRGVSGPPVINFKSELGLQQKTFVPKFLGSYEAAMLTNQALVNSDQTKRFTDRDIELFKDGSDPYGHPDVDWFSTLMKPTSLISRNNLDISGGTESVKYFVSLGYLWQNGALRDFSSKSEVNNTHYYKRYNFRSNLDFQATKTLNLRLDMTGRFGETNEPITNSPNGNGLIGEIYSYNFLPPFAYAVYNPDGSYGTNSNLSGVNVVGRIATQGYNRSFDNDLNITFGGTQKLDMLAAGLSAKGTISYASAQTNSRGLARSNTNFPQYYYNQEKNTYTPKDATVYRIPPYNLSRSAGGVERTTNIQASLNYDHNFDDHRVYGLALYNQNSYIENKSDKPGSSIPTNFRGITLRAGYDYKQKYLFEFNAARNGTDKFVGKKRNGWFPALSAGWNIAEESFFKKQVPFINLFKIRGSYGLVGSDNIGDFKFVYDQVYTNSGSYSFGQQHNNFNGIAEGTLGNDNVTWEKEKKMDIGLDVSMFEGKLSFTVDYFNNNRFDILTPRASVPLIMGIGLPPMNLGKVNNKGWDGEVNFKSNIRDFQYFFRGTFSYAKNKITFRDEANPRYPWLARTGQPIGQGFGYVFDGFYQSAEDIANSAKPTTPIKPGDLKYRDLNGDGIIDALDQRAVGSPNLPSTTMGLTLGFSYKGFSFSALIQGSYDYSMYFASEAIEGLSANFQPIHKNAWTPELGNNAKFPLLGTNSTISRANVSLSDFWLVDAKYLRLKTMEVGYQLPAKWVKPIGFKSIRVYANGYNLLTWTNVDKFYQADPESVNASGGIINTGAITAYPNQRIYNFGATFSL